MNKELTTHAQIMAMLISARISKSGDIHYVGNVDITYAAAELASKILRRSEETLAEEEAAK